MAHRSARTAAVVMAGLIGLALAAPGVAAAQTPPTEAECQAVGKVLSLVTNDCEPAPTATPTDTATPETPETPAPVVPIVPVPAVPLPADGAGTPAEPSSGVPGAPGAGSPAAPSGGVVAAPAAAPATLRAGVVRLQSTVNAAAAASAEKVAADAVPLDLDDLVPAGLVIPTTQPANGFASPQVACFFFAKQLTAPADDADALATQLAGFCKTLPTSFAAPDLTDLTDLLGALTDLLGKLMPALPTTTSDMGTASSSVPADYVPYFTYGRNIYNCGDLTFEQAQAILALDPSDPNRLDGDNDGTACDNNARGYLSSYGGYPRGGVATGDSDPTTEGGPVGTLSFALLLAAGASVGLSRRRADERV